MKFDYRTIRDYVEDAGLEEEAIRPRYSGRSMNGRECLAITTLYMSEFVRLVSTIASAGDDCEWLEGVSSDSLGYGYIWYWPNVQVVMPVEA